VSSLSDKRLDAQVIYTDVSRGKILAEDAIARVSVPSTMISAMDGYAIRSTESRRASFDSPVHLSVVNRPNWRRRTERDGECYCVSTGFPIPQNADAVVRTEDARITDGGEILITRPIDKWKNVVSVGQDVQSGQTVATRGQTLNAVDVALLMSADIKEVKVLQNPRVGVLSIGDDLQEFRNRHRGTGGNETKVNNFFNMIAGFLGELGIQSNLIGISKNDIDQIRKLIELHVDYYDLILLIGGSSIGERDYTINALKSANDSKIIFHGVRLVPIKPAGLTLVKGKPVVIVPAHASSAALTFFTIVLPVANIISGLQFDDRKFSLSAICEERIENHRAIDALALVQLRMHEDGKLHASHLGWYSNLLSKVAKANGFVQMKARQVIPKSELMNVELLGSSQLGRIARLS
jgi:molybdopterin molybdotransferase